MNYYNERLRHAWKCISNNIDVQDKVILDVGCGHGDIIKAAHLAGAIVYGLDKDIQPDLVEYQIGKNDFSLIKDNVNNWGDDFIPFKRVLRGSRGSNVIKLDIIICFSVLPYLNKPLDVLDHFRSLAPISIIECQYYGDGPGLVYIKDDDDMERTLKAFWDNPVKIGETLVEGRQKYRSIWLCQ